MLRKLQKDFKIAIINKKNSDYLLELIKDNITSHDKLLDIYRNNIFHSLTNALKSTYPTVKNTVGDEFFKQLAHLYIKNNLPRVGSLIYYGKSFIRFVHEKVKLHKLTYLTDIAKFDWLWHECYHAYEDHFFEPKMLKKELNQEIELKIRDSVRLFSSKYNIDKVLELSQKIENGEFINELTNIFDRKCYLLILRDNYNVKTISLNWLEYNFLLLFSTNKNLETIFYILIEKYNCEEYQLIEMLSKFICLKIFKL
jgi:hypothetical protein